MAVSKSIKRSSRNIYGQDASYTDFPSNRVSMKNCKDAPCLQIFLLLLFQYFLTLPSLLVLEIFNFFFLLLFLLLLLLVNLFHMLKAVRAAILRSESEASESAWMLGVWPLTGRARLGRLCKGHQIINNQKYM